MTQQLNGRNLLFTFFSIALWALLLVISRIILLVYQIDPWSFTFIQLISGGLLLIALSAGAGNDALDWRSIKRPSTWVYGALRVTTAAAFTAALVHVSVVYGGFLGTINVTLGVIGAWIFFSRRPTLHELPGHLLIMGGIFALITLVLQQGFRNPAVILMLISEVAVVASALIAEKHPDNNSSDPKARLRFTGVVLLMTAGLFLLLRVGQSGLFGAGVENEFSLQLGWPLWVAGVLVGITLRGPAMHTSLKAIRLVGTETYLMAAATLPFIGWGFEIVASSLDIIDPPPSSAIDTWLGIAIASGSIFIILARRYMPVQSEPVAV